MTQLFFVFTEKLKNCVKKKEKIIRKNAGSQTGQNIFRIHKTERFGQ